MQEHEVKVLDVNVADTIRKLEAIGAKKVFEGELSAYYFDFSDKRLSEKDKSLRLRKKGSLIEITYKESLGKTRMKAMDEHECHADDFETMRRIFNGIGLEEYKRTTKHRISYQFGDLKFELDTYPGIPTFLEFEAPSESRLEHAVRLMGYDMDRDTKPWSGKRVLEHYGKR